MKTLWYGYKLAMKSLEAVTTVFAYLSLASLLAMMFITDADVAGRFFFGSPIRGSIELTETLMVAVVFFAIAHTQAQKAHISMEILVSKLRPKPQTILSIVALLIALGIFSLITWRVGVNAYKSVLIGEFIFGGIQFPIWPAKIVLVLGCGLLCLQYIKQLVQNCITIRNIRPQEEKESG